MKRVARFFEGLWQKIAKDKPFGQVANQVLRQVGTFLAGVLVAYLKKYL